MRLKHRARSRVTMAGHTYQGLPPKTPMPCETTLYEALEVSPRASALVIKAAYRHLAQFNHPDKNPESPVASEKLVQINHAYSILSDPDKRQRYDQTLVLHDRSVERRGSGNTASRTRTQAVGQPVSRPFVLRPLI